VGSAAAMNGMWSDVIGKADAPAWIAWIIWAKGQLDGAALVPHADTLLVDQAFQGSRLDIESGVVGSHVSSPTCRFYLPILYSSSARLQNANKGLMGDRWSQNYPCERKIARNGSCAFDKLRDSQRIGIVVVIGTLTATVVLPWAKTRGGRLFQAAG
jgi:hypothetical protein